MPNGEASPSAIKNQNWWKPKSNKIDLGINIEEIKQGVTNGVQKAADMGKTFLDATVKPFKPLIEKANGFIDSVKERFTNPTSKPASKPTSENNNHAPKHEKPSSPAKHNTQGHTSGKHVQNDHAGAVASNQATLRIAIPQQPSHNLRLLIILRYGHLQLIMGVALLLNKASNNKDNLTVLEAGHKK